NKLNTVTKYPSILTYHAMGDKGRLAETLSHPINNKDEAIYLTEKIDGTNARMIFCGKDYVIGSREELLYAKGDRIVNPTLGIVNKLKSEAEKISNTLNLDDDEIVVVYGEVYGGNIGKNKKNYTKQGHFGFRVFDLWRM